MWSVSFHVKCFGCLNSFEKASGFHSTTASAKPCSSLLNWGSDLIPSPSYQRHLSASLGQLELQSLHQVQHRGIRCHLKILLKDELTSHKFCSRRYCVCILELLTEVLQEFRWRNASVLHQKGKAILYQWNKKLHFVLCSLFTILLEDLDHCLSKVDFAMLTANSGSWASLGTLLD